MIKKMTIKKISIATILLFLCLLFVIFPKEDDVLNLDDKSSIEYTSDNFLHKIYMVNKDNYVAMTNVLLDEGKIEAKARQLIEYLIIGGKKESNVPNGFRSIIPSGTEIKDINLKDGILTINFSKDILEISEELEEKMIETIVYSLTTIDGIKGVLINVEGTPLNLLPKTGTNLPTVLTRDIGINKVYNVNNLDNICKTTVYYIGKNKDDYYYVPVTKITNNENDKIEIIIDELSNGPILDNNLMSFLNINTKLLDYNIDGKSAYLKFDNNILNNLEDKSILEEVINTISLSIGDNYDVEEVIFMVNDDEITKSVLKTLE